MNAKVTAVAIGADRIFHSMQGLHCYDPITTDRTLLRALLERDEVARRACSSWLDTADFVHLNEGIRRLLPLLYSRISSWDLQHPSRQHLKEVYLHYWVLDQKLRRQLNAATNALASLDSPIVLLKGLALGEACYTQTACRPSSDIDLLVNSAVFDTAISKLLEAEFIVKSEGFHATLLTRRDVPELDIHRSPYHEAFSTTLVAPLFERLILISGGRPDLFRLGDEDQLLHSISHGLRPNVVSPLRWIVDAVFQLRKSANTFDWDLFVGEAERLNLKEAALQGLEIIDTVVGGVVDNQAIRRLTVQSSNVTRLQFSKERNVKGPATFWYQTMRSESFADRLQLLGGVLRRIWREKGTLHILKRSAYWLAYYAKNRTLG